MNDMSTTLILWAALLGAIAAGSMVLGAMVGITTPMSNNTVGAMAGFGAGALISALAIELVAAQIERFGLQGLLVQMEDNFRLLTRGRRSALPRQQTLRATLDWSFELLSACEQTCLRRLGMFRGSFTLESAAAVIGADRAAGIPPKRDIFFGVALNIKQLFFKNSRSRVGRMIGSGLNYFQLPYTGIYDYY